MIRRPPRSTRTDTLFPYTTLFRSVVLRSPDNARIQLSDAAIFPDVDDTALPPALRLDAVAHVRLAPWLGSSGIFVVNEECAARLPRECLVPAVDTDDIVDGVLGRPKRYAIMTFPEIGRAHV